MNPADRLGRVRADVTALGVGGPVRAMYEASKRFGGHRLIFGSLERHRPATDRAMRRRPVVGAIEDATATRTIAAADEIARGRVTVFASSVEFDGVPAWHATGGEEGGEWPVRPWWQIDIRSESRLADVKVTWELNRHRHLVVLARAASLVPDGRYAALLIAHLDSWLEANPLERGVQWYSNLEIALRALTWIEVLDLLGPLLPPVLVSRMERVLAHSARHLLADLPYTMSTMRNNHLLGDALAIEVLAARGLSGSAMGRIGGRLFRAQLARHMRADGSMIEDSLAYHRFVLEMLIVRVREGLADDETISAMIAAAQMLARFGVFEGPVPQYGDWDEGRVLVATGDPGDLRGTTRLALALAATGAPPAWRAEHDEVGWYAQEGEPVSPDPAGSDGAGLGGGTARAERASVVTWLKVGGGPSHGHADRTSVAVCWNGSWLVGDPGTGTYNGPIDERNYFRTSAAHSVLRVDDEDQLIAHRAFRWIESAAGAVGTPLVLDDAVVSWGVHDAYVRIGVGRVLRAVVTTARGVTIVDWVEDGAGRRWTLSLPLHPDVEFDEGASVLSGTFGSIPLALPGQLLNRWRGSVDPFRGWWSDTYDQRRAATYLELTGLLDGPVVWGLGFAGARRVDGTVVEVGGRTLSPTWHDGLVELRSDGGSSAFCDLA